MSKEADFIIYIYYCIEKEIITKQEIIQSADNEILNKKDIPYYLIELSLAKSLEELFFILDDVLPRNSINFKKLQAKCVLSQLYKLYRSKKKDILQIINFIFHLKDDIDLDQNLLNDIYVVDNDRDLYLSNIIELKELEVRLNSFFQKYI